MYCTKRYHADGTAEVIVRKPTIEKALYQHIQAVREAEDPETVITTNPKGIIYGYGYDIGHFKKNKRCRIVLRIGFASRYQE
jgi:hypothetical protein